MGQHGKLYNNPKWKHPKRGLRGLKLKSDPLCWYCEQRGIVTAANVVDHIVPHEGDEDLFFDWDNLRSSCKACHDSAAQLKDRLGYVPGVGVDGMPIDPLHPFYQK